MKQPRATKYWSNIRYNIMSTRQKKGSLKYPASWKYNDMASSFGWQEMPFCWQEVL